MSRSDTRTEPPVAAPSHEPDIDEYLRKRLMPVEGAIPHLPGIDMYGDSIPAGAVGGDLFEYINFQQRYDIDARIQRALALSREYLEPLPAGAPPRNAVDDQVAWLKTRPEYGAAMEQPYRLAQSSQQVRVAEDLHELHRTAGVLIVDAQGHGTISAKIASTVHDTFHAFMLTELDRYGKTTPELFEQINVRLAHSVTARNALGAGPFNAREIATMVYGEVHPEGGFRFVNFGHPPPLLFSAADRALQPVDTQRMVQFFALGLEIPENHPDRKRYSTMHIREKAADYSDIAELKLMRPGDAIILYSDGVYDGTDQQGHLELQDIIQRHCGLPARDICRALLQYAVGNDQELIRIGEPDRIDDKTVFVIKRD